MENGGGSRPSAHVKRERQNLLKRSLCSESASFLCGFICCSCSYETVPPTNSADPHFHILRCAVHLAQAMTINARVHSLQLQLPDGSSQPVASVLRSGGFATHGRKPRRMGLAALKEMADYCQLREVSNR